MEPSTVESPWLSTFAGGILASGQEGHIINLTLLNVILLIFGPMSEPALSTVLLGLQVRPRIHVMDFIQCTCGFL
jgi:hypothetical protein